MDQFTLEEANRWIGRTVIAKTEWQAGSAQMAAEQQGTVIGVQGEYILDGDSILCLAVQLWPEKPGDLPTVIFVPNPSLMNISVSVTLWGQLHRPRPMQQPKRKASCPLYP